MWLLSLVFSTKLDVTLIYLARCYNRACHSFSAYHGGDTVDENQEQSHTRDS